MKSKIISTKYYIDKKKYLVDFEGEFSRGVDQILFLEKAKNNLPKSLMKSGWTIEKIFTENEFKTLKKSIKSVLLNILNEFHIDCENFKLKNYHNFIGPNHYEIIKKTRLLTFDSLKINSSLFCDKISNIIGKKVIKDNPLLKQEVVILRINRPQSFDFNPLHRDGYLKVWENTINIWIPIAGCNSRSSLPLIPGSHLINERKIIKTDARSAKINNKTYNVPAIVDIEGDIKLIRPNPKKTNALIFTPFLIHGAAHNENRCDTRFSLEIRLFINN